LEVGIVRNQDDVFAAMAIRAIVMVGEVDRKFSDEFDGADMNATLILVRVGGEPAGTIRLRWYAGFAKLERVAILRAHRSLRVFNALAKCAIDHAREKGFSKLYGHALPDTVKLWQRFGFEPMPGGAIANYGRPEWSLVVMTGDLDPTCGSEELMNDHELLMRPEHGWTEFKRAAAAKFPQLAAE
jgi:GNAT superfamily N-acetyltransferase